MSRLALLVALVLLTALCSAFNAPPCALRVTGRTGSSSGTLCSSRVLLSVTSPPYRNTSVHGAPPAEESHKEDYGSSPKEGEVYTHGEAVFLTPRPQHRPSDINRKPPSYNVNPLDDPSLPPEIVVIPKAGEPTAHTCMRTYGEYLLMLYFIA
jgi:hypothetical protein